MTTEPDWPIVSSDELKPGQQYRHGWSTPWLTATKDTTTVPSTWASWVEAKPAPIQVGDRVQWESTDITATVKYAGEEWLIVQVDDPDDEYEDAWGIHHTKPMEDDDR